MPRNNYLCKKNKAMTLIDFLSHFPDEESCKQKFKAY
ncbi:IS1595 family transposase, partial [Tannerella forsythia]